MFVNIDADLLDKLPNIMLGCIHIDVVVEPSSPDLLKLIEADLAVIERHLNDQSIRELLTVKTTKDAYRILGKDPNRYRPSSESLLRRISKGKGLYQINNVVDILNLISVRTGYSICGFDSKKINGDILLGVGIENEPYNGIGRGELNIENLPVFRDNVGAFGTPTSDSLRTMITEKTNKVLLIFFAVDCNQQFKEILEDTVSMYEKYANGKVIDLYVINK